MHTKIDTERAAGTQLEDRVRLHEQALPSATARDTADEVDKSVVVVGGFGDKALEDAETLLREASENRSCGERCRLKAVSKLQNFLIELGGFPPEDVIASYKLLQV